MIQFLLFVFAMKLAFFLLILTPSMVGFAHGNATEETNQEFDLDSFEKSEISDQNQDATIFGDSEPFGSEDKGNYFVYQHVPKKDHYDFAYKRGTDHHVKEHYEKAAPHEGRFRTQARWGDKHGGYGEHYWDYNHGGGGRNEGAAGNEEINAEFSGNIQSPSVIPPVASNLDSHGYDIYENQKSTSPKLKYSSQKWKKSSYDDTKNRKYRFESSTEGTPFATGDAGVFVLPKVRRKTFYSPVEEQAPGTVNRGEISFDVDLYERLKNTPDGYDQYGKMNPTALIGKPSTKLFPTQESTYNF